MDSIRDLATALEGRYEIERELGRGGMATVYLARDLKHERRVAVKVLDPELAATVGGERFLAEIRLTAQLHHPNILALFDSGAAAGLLYYVMPYVPGETLRARLERERQLPVADAVRIASAVAGALEHAHKHGVIHRDLKPENILLSDGEPIVADFGIALAVRRAAGERLTMTGLSLGTPHYMSPEQATGDRVIDGRADIFSLGCVLYEMLAGDTPFGAPTAQATIARILTETPRDLAALRASVPANVVATVDRALEKLPADRWSSAREFAEALADTRVGTLGSAQRRPVAIRSATPWIVAAAAIAVAVWGWMRQAPAGDPVTLRLPIVVNDSQHIQAGSVPGIPFAVSSDDRRIVYVGRGPQGRDRLYIQALDELQTRPLAGTEGQPLQPTFSPDGRWIAFVLDDKMVRIPADGGPISTILRLDGAPNSGITWVNSDTIIASVGGALIAVPAVGGAPIVISRPDSAHGEIAQWGPHLAADGRVIAYVSVRPDGVSSFRVATLVRGTGRRTITPNLGTTVLGTIDDRVLWVTANGTVMAAPVDRAGVIGNAEPLFEGVLVRPGGAAKATLSARGSLLYERGERIADLMVVDQRGSASRLGLDRGSYAHPRWSPDGKQVAVAVWKSGTSDIWLYNVGSKVFARATSGGSNDQPEWSGDGSRLIYRSLQSRGKLLAWQRTDGSAAEQLQGREDDIYEGGVSRDGKLLFYRSGENGSRRPAGVYARLLSDTLASHAVSAHPASLELAPRLSPDGRWMVSASNESGVFEIYASEFPGPGRRYRVSIDGGFEPLWSPDGRTIYYRNRTSVMAATITTSPAFSVVSTARLFEGPYITDASHANWDVTPDGKSFLMIQSAAGETATVFVYGWANELRRSWRTKR